MAALVVAVGAPVCGMRGGLATGSTRSEFAGAWPGEQARAISKLSSGSATPEYDTPLGGPDAGYHCSENPGTVLEEFFDTPCESEVG